MLSVRKVVINICISAGRSLLSRFVRIFTRPILWMGRRPIGSSRVYKLKWTVWRVCLSSLQLFHWRPFIITIERCFFIVVHCFSSPFIAFHRFFSFLLIGFHLYSSCFHCFSLFFNVFHCFSWFFNRFSPLFISIHRLLSLFLLCFSSLWFLR